MPTRAQCITRVLAMALLLASACSTTNAGAGGAGGDSAATTPEPAPPPRLGSPPAIPVASDAGGEQARITRLERDARALARTTGCTRADACRAAPAGARPCGGPRTYVVYCAATTDTVALFAKLRELERAEKAYNERSGMMGTCEFRSPPGVSLAGGSCREAAGAGANRVP